MESVKPLEFDEWNAKFGKEILKSEYDKYVKDFKPIVVEKPKAPVYPPGYDHGMEGRW